MAQVKVYGIRGHLDKVRAELSATIHDCVVEALQFPRDKRAHRFFHMDAEDMLYPEGRSNAYTIVGVAMIEGRSVEAKKQLIRLLFERVPEKVGISTTDLEICIQESPAHNWGFRGQLGDEIQLEYRVDV
ncbi:MAG: tautomerase family protein [Candidatus Latescibacteria bacterium]|jgi:phenylpyruvate tautomerase PptA (4-oxalocrotonate tautomerase family)|nr:tautomerase family protein [Gemmatimonadaceae bacterium]MDP6015864.1 tautomerase family protein [Candidatus Latescibacterota bacterium]MDP7448207.1 tautomerase family protein [Candidatus Latescibacterota bacterium]HJP32149.1 tautomerase family protein [Candidatus Latescibacterota bacterium]|tara:strand:+ start:30 stop:419 length:390 start_codon:yes stop_codon:yes gene_type:complete